MRRFLFLQGVCSPFFGRLADRLVHEGHLVTKVNFNAGDAFYWAGRKSRRFRGRPQELRDFYDRLYRHEGITDQVLFGDRRPVHRPAVDHGEACGVRTHVFEEGYFRPHWVTLEREGVNGHSLLPRDPDWFWEIGGALPEDEPVRPFASSFKLRALHDVFYHLAGLLNPLLYPHYRTHASVTAPFEYLGYIKRFSLLRFHEPKDRRTIESLIAAGRPYFVLPLQLNSDAQIRDHSRFENMAEVMEYVMSSFAAHAPGDSQLVIKNHPLDAEWRGHAADVARLAREFDLAGRVHYLESGNLELLLAHARGIVTVNSTAGGVALGLGCPTVALSDPIYNLPGLTWQGALDDFWGRGEPPDAELFRRFRKAVIHCTQINGGFYTREGIELAVNNAARVLTAESSPLERMS